ncbi:MAG: ATP-dependent Zn protease [Cyanobacteria bacterium P01_H01_bin.130]
MSTTTLNLLAIAVFLMTASALLGPIINVSPTVPSAFIVAIAALTGLDRLFFEGQGGTLIVDWFANRSPDHRDRVLHHEAGHFLVAHGLGIPVTGYALSAWEAVKQGQKGAGGVRFDDEVLMAELEQGQLSSQRLRNYSTVWMAGIAAETLVFGDAKGGADDQTKLRSLLVQLDKDNPRGAPKFETQAGISRLRAKTMIEERRSVYDQLVAAMGEGQPVEACIALLEEDEQLPMAA